MRKNQKRNIIWFNPPYSKSLKRNMGKYFFRLLNKRFPPGHKLYKMFNKNTLKLSYSCTPNLKAKIDGHNKKILKTTPPTKTKFLEKRNLSYQRSLPQWKHFIYARVSCDDETYKPKLYKGICETTFKKRNANHKKSFNVEKNKNNTKLSTEYWKLANNKLYPRISWSIKSNYKSTPMQKDEVCVCMTNWK